MSKPMPAPHALLQQLVERQGAHWLSLLQLDAWGRAEPGDAVILIPGDPVRFPEGLDVAVVLPQLRAAVGRPLRIGVALPADEDAIGQRFGAQRRPSLVFLRDAHYVTVVAGMHDWLPFVEQVEQALCMPTTHAPIAIARAGGAEPACH